MNFGGVFEAGRWIGAARGLPCASRPLIDRSCRAAVGALIRFIIHAPVIAVLCPDASAGRCNKYCQAAMEPDGVSAPESGVRIACDINILSYN